MEDPAASGEQKAAVIPRKRKAADPVFHNQTESMDLDQLQAHIKRQQLEAEIFMHLPPNAPERPTLTGFISKMLGDGSSISTIPGQMPASMGKAALNEVSQNAYWVGEKSDGERRLMVILDGTIYFVDRKLSALRPVITADSLKTSLATVLSQLDGTILDGELIHHDGIENQFDRPSGLLLPLPTFSYICFDLCCISHDRRISNAPFSVRMYHFKRLVKEFLRPLSSGQLSFHYKRFWRREDISNLLQTLRTAAPKSQSSVAHDDASSMMWSSKIARHCFYRSGDECMWHTNDGIIFQPERSPYDGKWSCPTDLARTLVRNPESVNIKQFQADCVDLSSNDSVSAGAPPRLRIYKWKWPEMNTIDFMVKSPFFSKNFSTGAQELQLYTYGDGNAEMVVRKLEVTDSQKREFEQMIRENRAGDKFVIECAYDVCVLEDLSVRRFNL